MKRKKRILVVEDEPDLRNGLRIRLEASGYEIMEAENGESALDMIQKQAPDLIVLDLMLPRMGGYDVARELKSHEKHRNIPIVILTVRSQERDVKKGFDVGADAYITKPYKSTELLRTIDELISK